MLELPAGFGLCVLDRVHCVADSPSVGVRLTDGAAISPSFCPIGGGEAILIALWRRLGPSAGPSGWARGGCVVAMLFALECDLESAGELVEGEEETEEGAGEGPCADLGLSFLGLLVLFIGPPTVPGRFLCLVRCRDLARSGQE